MKVYTRRQKALTPIVGLSEILTEVSNEKLLLRGEFNLKVRPYTKQLYNSI